MSLPGNGIFVVKGELTLLMTTMKRGARWPSHSYQDDDLDTLIKGLQELKDILNRIDDLRYLDADTYLTPFLNVISEETTGPVTGLALSAVNKFLSYGIIDPTHKTIAQTVHNIADAVTHVSFLGTDQSSNGVVLLRILQVLRTLTLAPEGATLTNDSLCEIMLSCFRICFDSKLNDLLRRTAEHYLKDMVQLVFTRLPQFSEDLRSVILKQLKMSPGSSDQIRSKRKMKGSYKRNYRNDEETDLQERKSSQNIQLSDTPTTPTLPSNNIVDMQESISQSTSQDFLSPQDIAEPEASLLDSENGIQNSFEESQQGSSVMDNSAKMSLNDEKDTLEHSITEENRTETHGQIQTNNLLPDSADGTCMSTGSNSKDYINERGIRFTPQQDTPIAPYGLASIRELLRFLISLCNPSDKQNTEVMIHLGLNLLIVAFEVSADHIGKYATLLALVKDDLCRNLLSLLNTERLAIFAADLQLSFLLLESLRVHLKYQMESYLKKLMDIIVNDSIKVSYEHKEIALDSLLQLWRIPGYVSELYLNYDCDIYCTNLYEELTKLLSKNVMSANTGVYHTHLLSLDALLTVIENIEQHCLGDRDKSENLQSIEIPYIDSDGVETTNELVEKSDRIKISENVPTKEYLASRRNIKKWLPQGTEYFNQKPKKGIQFLQEHGVLKSELDPGQIASFLRENPELSKAMIGEYISSRNNLAILDAFVNTFEFTNVRIDEALRAFLETFRLPGEAPTISLILENFAEIWHKSNGEPFADVDSAFTLAYAIIMLNVDQHNENAKKQKTPMSFSAFKKNLAGVNGGNNFDEAMLEEIYNNIKNDEIVMPSEHSGLVKENYIWKELLKKGASKDGLYFHVNDKTFDYELYQLIYGSIVAALSFVYEKTEDHNIYRKVIEGFEKCARIASNFNMAMNLDMLILTLCKFTLFYNGQKQNNIVVKFGVNRKAQLALKTVFSLIHHHGDNIREGWKNIFDLILTLYINGLLPKSYIEAEDFIEHSCKIVLTYKETPTLPKQDTGLLSSLYSYMVSAENLSKVPTPEEQQATQTAEVCIKDCTLDQLISDSKFLHEDALFELVQTLIELSRGPDVQKSMGYSYNENVTVFFLELLIKVVIQNRDRVKSIWNNVRDHIYTLVMNASLFDYQFLLERSVIGLLRIALRLMRNEEMSPIVLQSLRMLLLLKSTTLNRISRQISFGLYELLKTSAQNIHTNTDWTIIFTLLECVGAGAQPPKPIAGENNQTDQGTRSDGENPTNSDEDKITTERGYTSDSELTKSPKHIGRTSTTVLANSPVGSPNTGGWILVGNEGEIQPVVGRTVPPLQYGLSLERILGPHDPSSLIKCCESLAFLVRDVAHITPYNFDECVHCIRTFVEASLNGSMMKKSTKQVKSSKKMNSRRRVEAVRNRKSPTSSQDEEEDSEDDNLPSSYHQISIQLLDLMHTLHTRTAQIFKWWAEEGGEIAQETSLWAQGWCPLLQGIARLCCDTRRHVRMTAITYLQRALLVHDLQTLTGPEWEQCFQRVLFPLLNYLLQSSSSKYRATMEETRIRAATVLSKVFLHHLTPLLSLSTFFNLWLVILDFMDKYMHADQSDLLYEAIPESLKNMLLVMDSAKVFDGPNGKNALWEATWERIDKFLPNMKEELFQETRQIVKQEIPSQPVVMQHNIQNATKSSIILQPPSSQQNISSHLFAHLGQMVSTPIKPTHPHDRSEKLSVTLSTVQDLPASHDPVSTYVSSPTTLMQPTLQPGLPYMSNLFPSQTSHSFPILYSGPFPSSTTTTTEVQPVSLYSEYLGNPYNTSSVQNINNTETAILSGNGSTDHSHNVNDISQLDIPNPDINKNSNIRSSSLNVIENNNSTIFFQSANYFNNIPSSTFIPAGSEILFGVNVQKSNSNILVDDNEGPQSTTGV